jgi:hypothetical protein
MLADRHSRRPKAGQGSPKAASASRARTKAPKSIIAALSDPDLFGGMFDAESWTPWRAFLSALWALPLSPEHLALYRATPAAASRQRSLRGMRSSSSEGAAGKAASWR